MFAVISGISTFLTLEHICERVYILYNKTYNWYYNINNKEQYIPLKTIENYQRDIIKNENKIIELQNKILNKNSD